MTATTNPAAMIAKSSDASRQRRVSRLKFSMPAILQTASTGTAYTDSPSNLSVT